MDGYGRANSQRACCIAQSLSGWASLSRQERVDKCASHRRTVPAKEAASGRWSEDGGEGQSCIVDGTIVFGCCARGGSDGFDSMVTVMVCW